MIAPQNRFDAGDQRPDRGPLTPALSPSEGEREKGKNAPGIAIIGMAGRFPKARNIDEFWRNLCAGEEGISFFTDEELAAAGETVPKEKANYIKARGILEGIDLFDAGFFGINPREAEVMDPQHRVFLECAWEALESAGCDPERFGGAIGVFAGMSMNTYLMNNLRAHPELIAQVGEYQAMLGNDKDFLPTRVSYKLNLKGPSLNIQTACSTSLVAVCVACQNLLNYECDAALAGAISISCPQKKGYLYQEGGIASPDGHCRAFDAKAAGTIAGEGVGIVVLKRLEEALSDGDMIYAVIKGFALNNDGSLKIGYTAPSVEGQAEVIAAAQAMADFAPESIGYIEAHGTGTPLGDPIEIEGLTKAFHAGTDAKNFCAVGSVKSNIGHLDTAAGVAGLIKTALALHHKMLPPSLHFESPNPKIDFANSPFVVNNTLREWKTDKMPRRAGVSSFGIGGTNAHVVLEEAPGTQISKPAVSPTSKSAAGLETCDPADLKVSATPSQRAQLLVLSAKTPTALEQATANLAEHLKLHPEIDLADVAYTLQASRREFAHRRMLVCHGIDQAVNELGSPDSKQLASQVAATENPPVVFMFPGQGAQHVNMSRELYEHETVFREQVDYCCELLTQHLGLDLRTILFPRADQVEAAEQQLTQTAITQPALFVIEFALAKLWMSWGVLPEAMIGHSIGEYVAACLAGVFSIGDALNLVVARGRLMQQMPPGAMLAVRLPEGQVQQLLGERLSLSAVNGVSLCVLSGPIEAIDEVQADLSRREIACTRLHTSHAFHSAMMEPVLKPFAELAAKTKRHPPQIPYLSNVTGTWIKNEEATDPGYWTKHLRQTVRYEAGVAELLKNPERVLLEVGPGQTLTNLARQHPAKVGKTTIVSSQPRAKDHASDGEAIVRALGQLWLSGVRIDWQARHPREKRRRVPLPTYPFERKRYWVEPAIKAEQNGAGSNGSFNSSGQSMELPARLSRSETVSVAGESPVSVSLQPAPATPGASLASELKALFGALSGRNLEEVNGNTTFIEMGFDSLFLTQASLGIEKKFNVQVAFRQLLDDLATFEALAAHLDRILPARLSPVNASPPSEVKPIARHSKAEQLLARLDELSDSEVEALLKDPELNQVVS